MSMIIRRIAFNPDAIATARQAWREMFGFFIQQPREATGRSMSEAARLAGMEICP